MDAQSVIVIVCVALALIFLGREFWRTLHPAKDGCGGCGCGSRANSERDDNPSRLELPMRSTPPRDS